MLSIPHLIVVFIVVLVVFGPQKLPELARGLGKLMAEFRKASTDFKSAFEEEMRDMERQALQAERKKAAEAVAASAAAEPSPPLAPPRSADAETSSSEVHTETRTAEDLVISPAVESVPRTSEKPGETKTEAAAVTNSRETPHDNQHPA
jgi:sec-independent protein translocase protein TatB